MSNFTHKPGNGAIFKNEKRTADTHPEYQGSATLESGEVVDLAVWVKTTKAGKKFFSLSIKPAKVEAQTPAPAEVPAPADDDLPF